LDAVHPADMMRAPMLGIGNLSPGFQISRQSDGHSSAVRPFDFYLLGLRVDVIEIIMRRHHASKPPSKFPLTASLYGNHAIVSNNRNIKDGVKTTSLRSEVLPKLLCHQLRRTISSILGLRQAWEASSHPAPY